MGFSSVISGTLAQRNIIIQRAITFMLPDRCMPVDPSNIEWFDSKVQNGFIS